MCRTSKATSAAETRSPATHDPSKFGCMAKIALRSWHKGCTTCWGSPAMALRWSFWGSLGGGPKSEERNVVPKCSDSDEDGCHWKQV